MQPCSFFRTHAGANFVIGHAAAALILSGELALPLRALALRYSLRLAHFGRQSVSLVRPDFILAAGLHSANLFANLPQLPLANALGYIETQRSKAIERHFRFDGWCEDGAHAIIIFLRDRVELVIVAAGASR